MKKGKKNLLKFFEISDVYTKTDEIHSKRFLSIIISGRHELNYESFNKKLDNKYLSDIILDLGLNDSEN